MLADFVYRANIRMIQSGRSLRLALEAGQSLWIFGESPRLVLPVHLGMKFVVPLPLTWAVIDRTSEKRCRRTTLLPRLHNVRR